MWRLAVLTVVTALLLFGCAGTFDWPMGWLYLALVTGAVVASRVAVAVRHPDMLKERAQFASVEGVQHGDRTIVLLLGVLGPILFMGLAGLDHRMGWSAHVPSAALGAAVVLIVAGAALASWAMATNPFFSAVVRLQQDRGQYVVASGPYVLVRHPGYAGSLLHTLAAPVMLDSGTAWIPALLSAALIVWRTAREDRLLREGLPGYAAYAERTPHRLLPGIW